VFHRVSLGKDARGNLTRIDNVLNAIPERLRTVESRLENLYAQAEAAKAELGKPFPQEDELRRKSARLTELNISLNIDERIPIERTEDDLVKKEKPSVLAKLRQPSVNRADMKRKPIEKVL
jgi:hypothetical protein